MIIDAKTAIPYEAKGYKEEDVEAFRNILIKDVTVDHLEISSFIGFGTKAADVTEKEYLHCVAMRWGGLPPSYEQYIALIKGQGSADAN